MKSSSTTTGFQPGPNIAIAHSLPPAVSGEIRGELVVCVERLVWNYRKPPQQVQIRLRWWGAAADTVVPFHTNRGAGAAFPLTSGPRYLSRYLKDMGSMSIALEECPSGRTVGQISVDISTLDLCKPIEASVPLKGSNSQLLATADVSMRVHYSALLSSFELNEHLASADKQLPLYPVPASQQQTAEAAPAALPSVPGKQSTTALQSCTKAANRTSDTDKPDQQQLTTANTKNSQAAAIMQPAVDVTSQISKVDQQQLLQSSSAHQQVLALAAAEPAEDPLLDIVRKAEQLKQAMDQAAQRGICLALPQAGGLFGDSRGAATSAGQASASSSAAATGSGLYMLQLLGCPPSQHAGAQTLFVHNHQQLHGVHQGLPVFGTSAVISSPQRLAGAVVRPGLLAGAHSMSTAVRTLPWPAAAAAGRLPAGKFAAGQHHQLSRAAAAVLQLPLASSALLAGSADVHEDSRSYSSSSSCSGSSISELEDLEEIEDLLLQELFISTHAAAGSVSSSPARSPQRQQQQQQQTALQADGERASAAAAGATDAQQAVGVEAAIGAPLPQLPQLPQQQQQQQKAQQTAASMTRDGSSSGPLLQVDIAGLQGITAGSTTSPCTITAVIKSAGRACCSLDVTALLRERQRQQQQAANDGCRCPCSAVVAGPSCLSGPILATDKPCLAVELWCSSNSNSSGIAAVSATAAGELLGIVRVPLQQQAAAVSSNGTTHLDQLCFASGTFPVYDVLRGKLSGTLELQVLLAEVQSTADAEAVDAAAASSAEQTNTLAKDAVADAAVVAVRHVFDVTVHSASHLPDAQQLLDGSQDVPEGRFMRYSFPGEEPLYTQEVDVVPSPTFSAHAQHTVVLPDGESLADCLPCGDHSGEQETLLFEVFNKWEDDTDSLVASGSLPLQQVLLLSQVDHPATSQATACMRTYLVPLQLAEWCGEAAVQQPGTAVLLQVTISYSAVNCYSMQEVERDTEQPAEESPEPLADDDPAAAAAAVLAHVEQQAAAIAAEEQASKHADGMVSGNAELGSNPLLHEQHACASSDSSSEIAEAGAGEQLSEQQAPGADSVSAATAAAAEDVVTQLLVQQAEGVPGAKSAAAAAMCSNMPQGPQYLSSELCVEVIRACGLQAAVKDAVHCLAGGSALLGRAQQLGPHPYATVALPFGSRNCSDGASLQEVLKTPFQAQTFCPQFSHQQVVPITLDAATLYAIATANCTVELWHHCPRSQAVAAALSRGKSSSYVMEGQQRVLLGSATCRLQALLTRPQGIKNWLVLKSQLGQPVGAVQVSLTFTHIGGTQHDTCPAAPSPLSRHPELLPLLPDSFLQSVGPLLSAARDGFQGQLARIALHVEELLLPGGDDALLERPKIANYMVSYRLPGSQADCRSHSKASSSQQTTSLLARSWHVDWQFCGTHWAVADWRIARALQTYPLQLTVTKQEPSRRSSTGGTAGEAVQLPVGSVEVDLSSLLLSRPGGMRPNCRWLSGTFAVVHPMCKNLGNTRLKVKVLLDLQPAETPPKHLLADPVAFWQITGALPAMPTPQSQANGTSAVAAAVPAAAAAVAATGNAAGEVATKLPSDQLTVAAAGGPEQVEADYASTNPAAAGAAAKEACSTPEAADIRNTAGAGIAEGVQESVTAQQQSSPELAPALASLAHATVLDASGTAHFQGSTLDMQQPVAVQQQPSADVAPAADSAAAVTTCDAAGIVAELSAPDAGLMAHGFDDMDAIRPIANRRSRLRAEVSHASAPASTRSSSPEAATGAQQQHYQHQLCEVEQSQTAQGNATAGLQQQRQLATQQQPQQPEQDQAPLLLQQQQQISPLQQLVLASPKQQQQLQRWTDQPGSRAYQQLQLKPPGSMQDVCVCVEGVLNLQLPGIDEGWEPCLYVSYYWKAVGEVIATPIVPANCAPLSQTASAKWFHSVCLPLATQQQAQHSDEKCGSELTAGQQCDMKVQVWLRCLPAAYVAALPPLYAGIAAAPAGNDQLLGCATLDLAALHALGSIEGWYNVCDAAGQPRGQLKVSLTPLKQTPSSRRALSHPGTYSACSAAATSAAAAAEHPAVLLLPAIPSMDPAGTVHDCSSGNDAAAALDAAEAGSRLPTRPEAGADASATVAGDEGGGVGADSWLEVWGAGEVPAAPSSVTDDVSDSDVLLATLRANLQELDAISASLAKRVTKSASPDLQQACQGQRTVALPNSQAHTDSSPSSSPTAAAAAAQAPAPAPESSSMQQHSYPSAAAEAAAARAHAFRHVQTLSDDEDYMVAVGGVSESDTDTEELMGRVDWSLAQNSDEECYPGPPPGPPARTTGTVQHTSYNAAAAAAPVTASPAATAAAPAPHGPLNTDEWMFDISRPAAAAAAGSSSSRPAGPVNPAQLSQSEAAAATAAAAARLAEAEAARAAAAVARAAAQQRNRERAVEEAAGAAAPPPATAQQDVWRQLAELEDAEDQARQQQQQQQPPAAAAEVHDARQLPEQLEKRLDQLLANFQAAANGPPPGAMQRPAAAPHPGGSSSANAAAAAASRAVAFANDDWDDDNLADDSVDYSRHDHMGDAVDGRVAFANCLPPVQDDFVLEFSDGPYRLPASAQQPQPAAAVGGVGEVPDRATRSAAAAAAGRALRYDARWDEDSAAGEDLVDYTRHELRISSPGARGVAFANCLPPVQDNFVLEYSDAPRRMAGHVQHIVAAAAEQAPPRGAAAAPAAGVQPSAAAAALKKDIEQPGRGDSSSGSGSTSSGSTSKWQHPAAAGLPVTAVASACTSAAAPGSSNAHGSSSSSRGSGFVPVIGDYNAAMMDDMFSFSKRSSSSSSVPSHPAVTVNPAAARPPARAAAVQLPLAAAATQLSAPVAEPHSVPAASSSSRSAAAASSSTAFVPVLGQYSEAGLDHMFSFRKRGSGRSTDGNTIKHPGM